MLLFRKCRFFVSKLEEEEEEEEEKVDIIIEYQ